MPTSPYTTTSVRLPVELLTNLGAAADKLSAENGIPISRNALIEKLLTSGVTRLRSPEPVSLREL